MRASRPRTAGSPGDADRHAFPLVHGLPAVGVSIDFKLCIHMGGNTLLYPGHDLFEESRGAIEQGNREHDGVACCIQPDHVLRSAGRGLDCQIIPVYRNGKPCGFWEHEANCLQAGDIVVEILPTEATESDAD